MKSVREVCCFKFGGQKPPFWRKSESYERKMQRSGERHSKQKEEHMKREPVWYICEMARKPSTHIMQAPISHCWGLDFTLKRDGKVPGIGTELKHALTSDFTKSF